MSVTEVSTTPSLLARTRTGAVMLAVIAPLGPLLMALSLFVMPFGTADDIPTSAAKIMESPSAAQWGMLFIVLSAVFGSVGSVVVAGGIQCGSPRLGAVAAAIAFVGWVAAAYPGPIASVAAAPGAGLSEDQTLALIAGVDGQVQGMLLGALFVCLPAGVLLLGVAALIAARRRSYPLWVALLLVTCIPVVIASGLLPGKILALGWLVVAAAYAAAGAVYAGLIGGAGAPKGVGASAE